MKYHVVKTSNKKEGHIQKKVTFTQEEAAKAYISQEICNDKKTFKQSNEQTIITNGLTTLYPNGVMIHYMLFEESQNMI